MKLSKNIILRFIIFAFLLLIVIPLWFSTFLNIHYIWAIRASFFFLKIFKLAIISCLLLFFIIWPKVKQFNNWNFDWKQTIIFTVLTLLLFFGSFYTQQDMSQIVNKGVTIKDGTLNFDGGRWLGFSIIGDTGGAFYDSYIENEATLLKKQVYLEEIPAGNFRIIWHGFWEDTNGNGELDSKVFMIVNNDSFDVTEKYSALKSREQSWIEIVVPSEVVVVGVNELIIQKKELSDVIRLTSQDIYQEDNSFVSTDLGITWEKNWREFLLYIALPSSSFYNLLFKLGFIFRILGIISLFIAVFGFNFSKFVISKYYKELFFSTIFAYWVYWFSEFVKSQWEFFAGIVAKTLFFLFKFTGFRVFINMSAEVPTIGIPGFVAGVYDVCSGVDSLGFFTLAYFMLIVFHWRKIIVWKALLMFVPGLVGIFLLNILRVYILIIIGAKFSSDFALNAFHTNAGMVFSMIYFLLFLPFVLKVIEKKKK